jgi:hypothetical protein
LRIPTTRGSVTYFGRKVLSAYLDIHHIAVLSRIVRSGLCFQWMLDPSGSAPSMGLETSLRRHDSLCPGFTLPESFTDP